MQELRFSFTIAMEVGEQLHARTAFPPEKEPPVSIG
jgi:hypothetical protein